VVELPDPHRGQVAKSTLRLASMAVTTSFTRPDPGEAVALAESVATAFLVVLETPSVGQ
jgi:hypothetical protein